MIRALNKNKTGLRENERQEILFRIEGSGKSSKEVTFEQIFEESAAESRVAVCRNSVSCRGSSTCKDPDMEPCLPGIMSNPVLPKQKKVRWASIGDEDTGNEGQSICEPVNHTCILGFVLSLMVAIRRFQSGEKVI